MCKAIGMILAKGSDKVYYCEDSQSHEKIKEKYGLKDTNSENLAPLEIYPRGESIISKEHKDWEINFENKPAWLLEDIEAYKDKCYKALFEDIIPQWIKDKEIKSEMDLSGLQYKKLPDFGDIKVGGSFYCYRNQLTTLKGSPREVGGDFFCQNNLLTTLDGSPREVAGDFFCDNNQLTILEGSPEKVAGGFFCQNNLLTTLDGSPEKVGRSFFCQYNSLTTLDGSPEKVGGSFFCANNPKLTETYLQYLKRKSKGK